MALDAIQEFSEQLKSTTERLKVFNADRAIVRLPILPDETRALGFDQPEDDFRFLQGDVVVTESAYFLGERIIGLPDASEQPICSKEGSSDEVGE